MEMKILINCFVKNECKKLIQYTVLDGDEISTKG